MAMCDDVCLRPRWVFNTTMMLVGVGWFFAVVIVLGKRPVTVPIPVAKPGYADGTACGSVWESRSLPQNIL